MNVAKGLYAMWYREVKVFTRERARVFSSIVTPLLFMFVFGGGLGSIVSLPGMDYQTFIYPGFLAMAVLFNSVYFGVYIVWDRKIDFLKEVLITPLSRTTIFVGKVLGGITDSMIQATFLMLIGVLLGIPFSPTSFFLIFSMLLVLAVGLVSLGLIIGSFAESPQVFGFIGSFVVFPMFLLSGAFYPLKNLPAWMSILTRVNPISYAVDGLRGVILGSSSTPFVFDLSVVVTFVLVMVALGTWAFNRMKV